MRTVIFPFILTFMFVACGGDSNPVAPSPAPPPSPTPALRVTDVNCIAPSIQNGVVTVNVGATTTVACTVEYNNGTEGPLPDGTQWSSANPSIATVNNNGVVRGVAAGTTTIVVQIPEDIGSRARFQVRVIIPPNQRKFRLTGIVSELPCCDNPLRGATVEVVTGEHRGQSATTNAQGHYSIPRLTGNVTVSVRKEGYETKRVGGVNWENTVLNVGLRKLGPPPPPMPLTSFGTSDIWLRVGVGNRQLKPGLWRVENESYNCYWERRRNRGDDLDGIINNGNISVWEFVRLKSSDAWFHHNGNCSGRFVED